MNGVDVMMSSSRLRLGGDTSSCPPTRMVDTPAANGVLVAPELTEAGRDVTPCTLGRYVFFTETVPCGSVLPSNADGPVTSTLSTVTLGTTPEVPGRS